MRLHPSLCALVSKVGWHSEMMSYESPQGAIKIHACSRCKSYLLESHGLEFGGRLGDLHGELGTIRQILEAVGLTTASTEVGRLQDSVDALAPAD